MGFVECHRLFGKEVIVETPLFGDLVPLAQLVPIQFTGTSNTHFFGNTVPHVMELLQQKKFDEATEIYWRTAPARAGEWRGERRFRRRPFPQPHGLGV